MRTRRGVLWMFGVVPAFAACTAPMRSVPASASTATPSTVVLAATSAASSPRVGAILDLDDDGISDEVDACPNVPGPPSPDPAHNGCPQTPAARGSLHVEGPTAAISIGGDDLDPAARAALLEAIAKALETKRPDVAAIVRLAKGTASDAKAR